FVEGVPPETPTVNDPPVNTLPTVPGRINLNTVKSNETMTLLAGALLAGALDANGDTLTIINLTATAGTLASSGAGQWLYTPDPAYEGEVVFNFRVSDGTGSVAHSARVQVLPPDVPETPSVTGVTLIGTSADDNLEGGEHDDVIMGNAGNDALVGASGDDIIFGGEGNDTIIGGDGDDFLFGDDGTDTIVGAAGDDIIDAGKGDDHAFGGDGDDTFIASVDDGNDFYSGDAGSDTLNMSGITANAVVKLSAHGIGSASST